MRKISTALFSAFLMLASVAYALDPVAPKSERAFGFLSVETPLKTDVIQAINSDPAKAAAPILLKNDEILKVPVGDYLVKVKMQDKEWSQSVKVQPTELSALTVTGYGNLRVMAPDPANTNVDVYGMDGQLVSHFAASQIKTLPTGNYRVTVKLPMESGMRSNEVTKENISIVTNETRRVVVWK